jgi:hypothetical protein
MTEFGDARLYKESVQEIETLIRRLKIEPKSRFDSARSAKGLFKKFPDINSLLRKSWVCSSLFAEKRPTQRPTTGESDERKGAVSSRAQRRLALLSARAD